MHKNLKIYFCNYIGYDIGIPVLTIPICTVSPKSHLSSMAIPSRYLVIIGITFNVCHGTVTGLDLQQTVI